MLWVLREIRLRTLRMHYVSNTQTKMKTSYDKAIDHYTAYKWHVWRSHTRLCSFPWRQTWMSIIWWWQKEDWFKKVGRTIAKSIRKIIRQRFSQMTSAYLRCFAVLVLEADKNMLDYSSICECDGAICRWVESSSTLGFSPSSFDKEMNTRTLSRTPTLILAAQ